MNSGEGLLTGTSGARVREGRIGDAERARDGAGERLDTGQEAGAVLALPELRQHEVAHAPRLGIGDHTLEPLAHRDVDLPELATPSRLGTRSTTRPALRLASPTSALAPMPQRRMIATPTSLGE